MAFIIFSEDLLLLFILRLHERKHGGIEAKISPTIIRADLCPRREAAVDRKVAAYMQPIVIPKSVLVVNKSSEERKKRRSTKPGFVNMTEEKQSTTLQPAWSRQDFSNSSRLQNRSLFLTWFYCSCSRNFLFVIVQQKVFFLWNESISFSRQESQKAAGRQRRFISFSFVPNLSNASQNGFSTALLYKAACMLFSFAAQSYTTIP